MEYWHDTYGGLTMVAITKLIMLGIATVCALTLTFIVLEFVEYKVISKFSKKINRIHFYVAMDKNGSLCLYMGKPKRGVNEFEPAKYGIILTVLTGHNFEVFGLNENDYKDLKWEDEPVEVFINMED